VKKPSAKKEPTAMSAFFLMCCVADSISLDQPEWLQFALCIIGMQCLLGQSLVLAAVA